MKDRFAEERVMLREAALIAERASTMINEKIDAEAEKLEAMGKRGELWKLASDLPECSAKNFVLMRVQRMDGLLR